MGVPLINFLTQKWNDRDPLIRDLFMCAMHACVLESYVNHAVPQRGNAGPLLPLKWTAQTQFSPRAEIPGREGYLDMEDEDLFIVPSELLWFQAQTEHSSASAMSSQDTWEDLIPNSFVDNYWEMAPLRRTRGLVMRVGFPWWHHWLFKKRKRSEVALLLCLGMWVIAQSLCLLLSR